jgi:hypothetical protein
MASHCLRRRFGDSIASVGDANGDGIDDVLVGAPWNPGSGTYLGGTVRLLSGSSGAQLWIQHGVNMPAFGSLWFGIRCCAIGDVNGDGYPDAWVTGADAFSTYGAVLDGRTGSLLRIHNSVNSRPGIWSATGMGDFDSDGCDDYCFGSPADASLALGPTHGSVTFVNGRSGASVWVRDGVTVPGTNLNFGAAVAAFGDMNQDGQVDLVVSNPRWLDGTAVAGRAHVLSGADGSDLWTYGGATIARQLGTYVNAVGDLSGDGHADFAVSTEAQVSPTPSPDFSTRIFDGVSGQLLRVMTAQQPTHLLWGSELGTGHDLNGDRIPDVVVGVAYSPPILFGTANPNGLVFAVSLGFAGMRPLLVTRGSGCSSSAGTLPGLRVEGLPKLGTTCRLVGRALPPSAACALALGSPMSLSLAGLGAAGCHLYVDPGLLLFATAPGTGYLRMDFPLPNAPALQGLALSAQWLALDPAANALGIVSTGSADLELR